MSRNDPNESLAKKLGITAADLRERKHLLGILPEQEAELAQYRPTVELALDDVIEKFYRRQLAVPAIRAMIGDKDTLNHLKSAMRTYVLELFSGEYGLDYAAKRLRVGRVHGRIGIPSKYYISGLFQLLAVLGETLAVQTGSKYPPPSLRRLLLLDLELIFDTYVHGLLGQVEAVNEDLVTYSRELEKIVQERTEALEKLSRIDQLTGLRNRRSLTEALEQECAAARRRGGTLCLMFADLDGFKAINDREGHLAGDAMLKTVAQALRRVSRTSDHVFRYGGDEFCLILPDTGAEGAATLQDRISQIVAQATCDRLSLSTGWAISAPPDHIEPDELLRRADAAMYDAKAARRTLLPAAETARAPRPALPAPLGTRRRA